MGIGTIKILTIDGKIRTLTGVRHVPQLKKNLIFLGILNAKGFKFSGEEGTLCISKGSKVILKGIKQNILYILQGKTLTGSSTVASKYVNRYLDVTKLWHMRLGHMGERGMQILSKRDLLSGHKVTNLELCEHSIFGKKHRSKFSKGVHKTKGTLDYIHSGCWGPTKVEGI
ncbi:uncharacterized mitochondrial protein AtMg00300-like [Impatiens glandulifera]|uniref:uncharacterized mitochondrial protein AtMg00300-like n=1 Tax=Impatiens glandulifera TaxID=253017 RepID=UPI001FB14D2D|nr:uncharacterized mitochondrial protein AtMg00300-like [Impatiens glandulifera]